MIRWSNIFRHSWYFAHLGGSVGSYCLYGSGPMRRTTFAQANATHTLGRLLEAIR